MKKIIVFMLLLLFASEPVFAFSRVITVPAENSKGVVLDLEKGKYAVAIEGGAIALFYPINPNYRWLISVSIGTDADGGQDQPNIGIVYFEPDPPVHTQAMAEEQALKAVKENLSETPLSFILNENKKVRFWISDYDYSDNSGMVKLRISSI
ncbi:MAG: hypothetical protein PHV48_04895 [Candidatus Omnitrophica bacterium]|nr:hypothetical protein [Candidatus Omnitrophota bacterium]